ncbi:MAG: nuclear transport factor 2 family protein [Saprospiraceae bacterium]|nr:nuclear transport factor 2 family protein [Saprospiraceae bacterium]MBK8298213.1 nuclear transport factor 2 family protein [Saprospiraceae bacterium]
MKLYVFIIVIFYSSTLYAQENASIVLDEYSQAIGGQSYISRVQNIYSLANCIGPNGNYQTEIQSANGTKTIFRQIKENKPDYVGIVNGDTYWTKGIEVAISDKNSASAWRSHELQWVATHLTERFREVKFAGHESFAGKQAVKLSATDELNKTAYLYFDKNTNLLLGFTIFSPFNESQETIRLSINDWIKVGKLLLPSKVTFSDKQGDYILNFHTIKINQIDKVVFEIPKKIIAIKKLIELHELQRTAHFNSDAKLLVSIMADDYIEVINGKVNSPKKEDLIKRFQGYFDSVTFIEWDDIQPPIIKVSDDGTLAYVFVNKRVKLKTQENKEELTTFAWTATFQKINDNWLMTSITSTFVR